MKTSYAYFGAIVSTGFSLFPVPCLAEFEMPNIISLMRPARTVIKTSGTLEPASQFEGFATKKAVRQGSVDLSVPVYDYEKARVIVSGSYGRFDPSGEDTGIVKRYGHANLKTSYSKMNSNRSLFVADFSFGSASDDLFKSSQVNTISSTLMYSKSFEWRGEGPAAHPVKTWSWMLSYSNNRPFMNGVPLLGFAYAYTPSREFRLIAGLPFVSLATRFFENYEWNIFVLGPWVYRTKISYEFTPVHQVYGSFDSSQKTFLREARNEKNDRVFYDEKKAVLGFSGPVLPATKLTLEGGYSFDRRFYEARSVGAPKAQKALLESSTIFFAALEVSL